MNDDRFLSRWSRRKTEAKSAVPEPAPAAQAVLVTPSPAAPEAPPLPPVESLTIDSDFAPFMQPGVDAALRRTALKTLLADPRFNVMDGLDVYIDDYSKADPLPEGWLEKINAVARLGDYKPPEREAIGEEKSAQEQPVVPSLPDEVAADPGANSSTREEANRE